MQGGVDNAAIADVGIAGDGKDLGVETPCSTMPYGTAVMPPSTRRSMALT
jgi:hypothetical protein